MSSTTVKRLKVQHTIRNLLLFPKFQYNSMMHSVECVKMRESESESDAISKALELHANILLLSVCMCL